MKKSVLITLVAIILVMFVVLFAVIASKDGKVTGSKVSGTELTPEQRGDVVKEHQLELSKNEKSFNGIIGSVTTPKNIKIKILEVDGVIDDFEVLKNMNPDEFKGTVEVPTMKKIFKVGVDENTKLIGFENLDDIKSGDQVRINAGQDPRNVEEFTAIEIELNYRNRN